VPGPKRESFALYGAWLSAERGLSRASVNTYCSILRRFLRGVADPTDAAALAEGAALIPGASVGVLLSAWSAFRAFAVATHGMDLPDIPRARRAVAPVPASVASLDVAAPDLPADVADIVRCAGWSADAWGAVRWDHAASVVTLREVDHLVFRIPTDKIGLSLPVPAARRLLAWGWPAASDVADAPTGAYLLPLRPEAPTPFPAWRLRALLPPP
jgi:hypothetical protein